MFYYISVTDPVFAVEMGVNPKKGSSNHQFGYVMRKYVSK